MIPGGQFEEGFVRELVADQRGEFLGARLAAQVLLEADAVVERVQFEQGGYGGVSPGGVAP